MAEDILIARFKADLDNVRVEFEKYIDTLEKVQKEEKDTQTETKKTATTAESASKKRTSAIKAEEAELKRLQQARKLAFSVEEINRFNKKISETKDRISTLKGETQSVGASIKATFAGIGAGIAAAFSIQAVINFGKASVNAFLEAEENANRLKFAITTIGGESEVAFDRLIKQSAQLQEITVFSDDSIQQAQAALAAFGLTADEIEKLIPKLADFATITSQDIPFAAQQIAAALEGNGKEFKKYGIEVSTAASRTENLASVMDGLTFANGAAEAATKTLTGILKQAENQVGELQEQIGEKLAPSWVKVKVATLQAIEALLRYGKINAMTQKDLVSTTEQSANKVIESIKERNLSQSEEVKTLDQLAQNAEQERRVIKLTYDLKLKTGKLTRAEAEKIKEEILIRQTLVDTYLSEIAAIKNKKTTSEKAAIEDATRILALSDLQKKTTTDLIALRLKEQAIDDKAAKDNIKNIEAIIKARELYAAELAKNLELLRSLQIKNQEDERIRLEAQFGVDLDKITSTGKLRNDIIEQLQIDLNAKLKALDEKATEDEKKAIKVREEAFIASADKKAQVSKDLADEAEKIRKATFIEETKALPEPERRKVAESFAAELKADEAVKIKALDNDINANFEDNQNKKVIITAETTKAIKDLYDELGLDLKDAGQADVDAWFNNNAEIISATEDLVSNLVDLYGQLSAAKIQKIEASTEKELELLDQQSKANQENLDKRRISEREFANQQKKIEEDKVKTKEAAEKKINDIKRKQFNLEKAAALSEIAVDLAKAVAEVIAQAGLPGLALSIIVASAIGAQAAIVAAQPNPYKRGTKSAKAGLANVDEEGAEMIVRPAKGRLTNLEKGTKVIPFKQTRKYEKVFDAMIEDRFEDYVFRNYVTPELQKQKEQFTERKEKSLANNITKSMVINNMTNGKGDFYLERISKGGLYIKNVDELAAAIANQTSVSPYRR